MRPNKRTWSHRFRNAIKPTFRATVLLAIGAAGVLGATLILDGESSLAPLSTTTGVPVLFSQSQPLNAMMPALSGAGGSSGRATSHREQVVGSNEAPALTLSGELRDLQNAPVNGAMVFAIAMSDELLALLNSGLGLPANALLARATRTSTNAQGQFTLRVARSGDYCVFAISRTHAPACQIVDVATESIKLVAGASHSISGRVLDESGLPIPGASVTCVHPRGIPNPRNDAGERIMYAAFEVAVTTGEDGRFELSGLDESAFSLIAGAEGRATSKIVNVAVDSKNVEFRLAGRATLLGQVVNSMFQPVAGATVAIARTNTESGEYDEGSDFTTDENGQFCCPDAITGGGALVVKTLAAGFATHQMSCDALTAGETRKVSILLDPAACLKVSVVDPRGKRQAGALVEAYEIKSQTLLGTLVADEDGIATFANANANQLYRVLATATGCAVACETNASPKDPVVVKLQSAFQLAGKVVTEKNEAISGARLVLTRDAGQSADSEELDSAVSEANGMFRFVGIVAGNYTLRVEAQGFAPAVYSPISLSGSSENYTVKLQTGSTAIGRIVNSRGEPLAGLGVSVPNYMANSGRARSTFGGSTVTNAAGEFSLVNAPEQIAGLVVKPEGGPPRHLIAPSHHALGKFIHLGEIVFEEGGTIEGRVLDPSSAPVKGLRIQILGEHLAGDLAPTTVTDGNGYYKIENVQQGIYSLEIRTNENNAVFDGSRRLNFPVEIISGETTRQNIEFGRVSRLFGKVRANNDILALDLEVGLRRNDAFVAERCAALVAWDGSYELLVPEPGYYSIELRSKSGRDIRVSRNVNIASNGESRQFDIEVGLGSITGTVTGYDGSRAVVNAKVTIECLATGSQTTVQTDGDGRYSVTGLEQGRFRITAYSDGYSTARPTEVAVTSSAPQRADIQLDRGFRLTVVVLTPAGNPLTNALVRLWTSDMNAISNSSNQGGEARFAALSRGHYSISVEHPSFEGYVNDIFLGTGERGVLTITTRRTGNLKVQTRTTEGEPVPNREVWLTTSTGMQRRAVSNWEGVAVFPAAAEGPGVVELLGGDNTPAAVTAGDTSSITLYLKE